MAEDSDVEIRFSPGVQCLSHLDFTLSDRKDHKSHAGAKSDIPGQQGLSLTVTERTNDTVLTPNQDLATADAGMGGTVTNDSEV
jgi:hypothetical protein